jgi:hypothetical protein
MDEKETKEKEKTENPTETEQETPIPKSYILIEFEHPGSAGPVVKSSAVTPQQVVIAAKTLDMMAEDEIRARWQQIRTEEMRKQADLMRIQMQIGEDKKPRSRTRRTR